MITLQLLYVYARLVCLNQSALWHDTAEAFNRYCQTHRLAVAFERMYDPDSTNEDMANVRAEASRYYRKMNKERGNVLIAAAIILLIIVVGMMVVADGAGVDITPAVSSCYDLINAAGQVVGQSCH